MKDVFQVLTMLLQKLKLHTGFAMKYKTLSNLSKGQLSHNRIQLF